MRSAQILAAVFALSSVSSAWTWPEDMSLKGVSDFMLLPRQDQNGGGGNNGGNNNNNNNPNNEGNDPSPKSTKSSSSKTDSSTSKGDSETPKPTSKGGDNESSKTSDSQPTRTSFGNTIFPGSVKLKTPAPTSGSGLFKVGDPVTFGFNYSGVVAPLSAVDVMVSCTVNDQMYTVTANMSTNPSESMKVIWDTEKANKGEPLPVASYTLIIKDSDNGVSATADPGYLSNYMQYMFAMYTPREYTPLSDYDCATCEVNGGIANVPAHHTLSLLLTMTGLTVLSFTWFASNRFGVF